MRSIARKTHTIDATGQPLGRLASQVAGLLIGKGKRTYVPYQDVGDEVVVANSHKIKFTGNKLLQKNYIYVTGYPSGLRKVRWNKMFAENPKKLVRLAIERMLPKNKLKKGRMKRLRIQ